MLSLPAVAVDTSEGTGGLETRIPVFVGLTRIAPVKRALWLLVLVESDAEALSVGARLF